MYDMAQISRIKFHFIPIPKNLFLRNVSVLPFVFISTFFFCIQIHAQDIIFHEKPSRISWNLSEVKYLHDSNIDMVIVLYGVKKKDAAYHAKCAAIKLLLFEGVGVGGNAKPLLPEGEHSAYQSNPSYFQNLYSTTYNDFIKNCTIESEYKKADEEKGTKFRVVVKTMLLRRDLENNRIKNKMGI